MIKLLPFLLLFVHAYGQNSNYLLPDQNTLVTHTLEGILKHSHEEILIITPSFNHESLKRAALEGVKRGSHLTLIVQVLKGDPLALAQYERVDVRTLSGRVLDGSIILIDNKFMCTVPGAINSEKFSQNASLIRCSDDEIELNSLNTTLYPLIKRSKPYLE
jgi:hypothetical protein